MDPVKDQLRLSLYINSVMKLIVIVQYMPLLEPSTEYMIKE